MQQGEMLVVTAAQTCDEMVFECADGTFGGVALVDARRSEFKIDFFLSS